MPTLVMAQFQSAIRKQKSAKTEKVQNRKSANSKVQKENRIVEDKYYVQKYGQQHLNQILLT